MGLPPEEAAARLEGGDAAFVFEADPGRLQELARLDPAAPFALGLRAERAGDAVRARALFKASFEASAGKESRSAPLRLEAGTAYAAAAAAAGDAEAALKAARLLAAEFPEEPRARAVLLEALAAAGRKAAVFDLVGKDGSKARGDREAAAALLAAASLPAGGPSDVDLARCAEAFFLDGSFGPEKNAALASFLEARPGLLDPVAEGAAMGRSAVSRRDYGRAAARFRAAAETGAPLLLAWPETVSDMGKAFQYGGAGASGADAFEAWESSRPGGAVRFRLLFYAARMRRDAGNAAAADALFERALPLAPDAAQRDACLWYMLDAALAASPSRAVDVLRRTASAWSDPSYFSDVLDKLCGAAVAAGDWKSLAEAAGLVRTFGAPRDVARYAYVAGRAVSLGRVAPGSAARAAGTEVADREGVARALYRIAFEADSASFYYRCLAASRLGANVDPVPAEQELNDYSSEGLAVGPDAAEIEAAEASVDANLVSAGARTALAGRDSPDRPGGAELRVLEAFFAFGCADLAYPYARKWLERIDAEGVEALARRFAERGRWADSIRVAAALQARPGHLLTRGQLELLYPRAFETELSDAAERWGVPAELFFALARTESAFDPDVVSHAGAVGLAQLMPATAADVARRIKASVPLAQAEDGAIDLRDPATNAALGAYYLADQTRRLGSPLLALFAYNGGPTRVRRWRSERPRLSEDLFLETVPIAETRDYGRKVLAAAAVYGYLYRGKTLERVVADILPD